MKRLGFSPAPAAPAIRSSAPACGNPPGGASGIRTAPSTSPRDQPFPPRNKIKPSPSLADGEANQAQASAHRRPSISGVLRPYPRTTPAPEQVEVCDTQLNEASRRGGKAEWQTSSSGITLLKFHP